MTPNRIPFSELRTADLHLDATYEGGSSGTAADDPLARLLPCGNQGGFRFKKRSDGTPLFVVLYSDLGDSDWPDVLDPEIGGFTYFGDNKRPGHDLHDTHRGGNRILRDAFAAIHAQPPQREVVPPFLVFTKGAVGRDVVFRGLAVPGAPDVSASDDLVAIWRTSGGQRFQNYRATFTILDTGSTISRPWLADVLAGNAGSEAAPAAWLAWRAKGVHDTLLAPRTLSFRTPAEQQPKLPTDEAIIAAIRNHFTAAHDFEPCAAAIWAMSAPGTDYTLTPASRDGGRDAFGYYRLGPQSDPIRIDFALEAKCYGPGNSVKVKELARLISRLRHRQFGVLVTTSYLAEQAYAELREDGHPVVVLAGRDIVEILKAHGKSSLADVTSWLAQEFPQSAPDQESAA